MALKPDRNEYHYDIDWYMDEPAERGGVVVVQTADSGGYPGGSNNVVTYAASPATRKAVGVLLYDVLDVDPSLYIPNNLRMQVLAGSKVCLIKDGEVTTNMVASSDAPVGGETAYLGPSGRFTLLATNGIKVGQFKTSKDQDGFLKVRVLIAG